MNDASVAVPETPEPKKRGNPNWGKKPAAEQPDRKAGIISEGIIGDIWEVHNKDARMHYVWARKSSDEEINRMIQDGYAPARGKERIMRNPLESYKDEDGETKERGDRILMMCPKDKVQARRIKNANRYVSPERAARAEAQSMRGRGVSVESVTTSETKRESLQEEA